MKHMKGVDPSAPEVPAKKHLIYDHAFLTILFVFLVFVGLGTAAQLGVKFFETTIVGYVGKDNIDMVTSGAQILVALFMMLVYRIWFRRQYSASPRFIGKGLLMCLPFLAFVVLNLIHFDNGFSFAWTGTKMNPILPCLVSALAAGIGEEIIFRAIPVSNWLRVSNNGRGIILSTLVTSLVFGLVHGMNVFAGAEIKSTAFQVCYAFLLGIAFSAILLRSGTTLPNMFTHALIDFSCFLFMDMSAGGAITEELTFGREFYVLVGVSVFIALYGLFLLRPSKHEEICDMWEEKWDKAA